MTASESKVLNMLKIMGSKGVTFDSFARGFRLSARIKDLRDKGMEIKTVMETVNYGKRGRYFLINE